MILADSAPTTALQIIGALGGAVAFIGLLATAWKLVRDGGRADERRQAEDKALNLKVDTLSRQVVAIKSQVTPNGGNTTQLGDMVARIEASLNELNVQFRQHEGASDEVHKEMWRAIGRAKT